MKRLWLPQKHSWQKCTANLCTTQHEPESLKMGARSDCGPLYF